MATLSVWRFPTADGAEKAEETLGQLQGEGLIKVHDAALAHTTTRADLEVEVGQSAIAWPLLATQPITVPVRRDV